MILAGLLRHGEVEGGNCFRGTRDDLLTSVGWEQMRHATRGDCCWDQVITSPRQRCAAFANEYAVRHGLALSVEAHLAEIHFGAWEGRTPAELMTTQRDALKRLWENPLQYTPPEAEPLRDFAARVLDAWRGLVFRCTGQRVLIVTHGGVIRVLLCHIQQHPIGKLLEIEVKHGALFIIRISDERTASVSELIKQA